MVGWSGTNHELVPNGSVLIDGDKVASVGTDKSQTADKIIDASGRIVSPGFVNLHVHSQLNIGDYLLADVTKKDYLAANWFVFGAPLKEKVETPPPAVAMGRKYALYSAPKRRDHRARSRRRSRRHGRLRGHRGELGGRVF